MLRRMLNILIVAISLLAILLPSLALAANRDSGQACEPYARTYKGGLIIKGAPYYPKTAIHMTGKRFAPGTIVKVYWDGQYIGETTADSRGNASFDYAIPEDATRGLHSANMQGERNKGGTLVLTGRLHVIIKRAPWRGSSRQNISALSKDFPAKQNSTYLADIEKRPLSRDMLLIMSLAAGLLATGAGVGFRILRRQ